MTSKFEKSKKYIVIILFLIASVFAVIFMGRVAINYNISDYLDERTETKISLNIIESEFGMTGDVQVMIEDISVDTAKSVKATIESVENVLSVNFDENSTDYYKNGDALFVVLVDGDAYSDTANDVVSDVKQALDKTFEGRIHYGGGIVENARLRDAIQSEIPFVLAVALCLVVAIMLLTSKSWIEPIILLLTSGVAVLINMGTNLIFGQISYITNAVASILQLALSVDYSIVLLHSYRKLKETESDSHVAMKKSVREVVKPVSASALTTMAGLFALLFMSMKIGFDIGTVLIKGIVISAIVSLTLFPAVLLVFEKLLEKTQKREFVLKSKGLCKMAFKANKAIVPIALAVIIACGSLQFGNTYSFTDSQKSDSVINASFGRNNSVVVVYENVEDGNEKEKAFIKKLNDYRTSDGRNVLKNYTAYSNTVRESYDVDLASSKLQIPKSDVEMLFTMYHLDKNNRSLLVKPSDFFKYADELITSDPDAEEFSSEELAKAIRMMLVIDEMMNGSYTADEFHTLATTGALEGTELGLFPVKQMYGLYGYNNIQNPTISFKTMINYIVEASSKPDLSGWISKDVVDALQMLLVIDGMMNSSYTAEEFHNFATSGVLDGMDMELFPIKQMYGLYGYDSIQNKSLTARELVDFVVSALEKPELGGLVNEDIAKATKLLPLLDSVMNGEHTAQEFHALLTSGALEGLELDLFPIKQMYGLYEYENIPEKEVDFRTMVEFLIDMASDPNVGDLIGSETADALQMLLDGIDQFKRDMETPLTRQEFKTYVKDNFDVDLNDLAVAVIYALYNHGLETPKTEIPLIELIPLLVTQGWIDQEVLDRVNSAYETIETKVNASYGYAQFLPAIIEIVHGLIGQTLAIDVSADAVQQLYIMYFFEQGVIPDSKIWGRTFIEFLKSTAETNELVSSQLPKEASAMLSDITAVDKFLYDTTSYEFGQMSANMVKLLKDIQSVDISGALDVETNVIDCAIQQLYIMYLYEQGMIANTAISGREFVKFIRETAQTNAIVGAQVSKDVTEKLADVSVVDSFLSDTATYGYQQMVTRMAELQNSVQSVTMNGSVGDEDAFQQLYITYFYENGMMPNVEILGREFVEFIKSTVETNDMVSSQLSQDTRAKLADITVVDAFISDATAYDFKNMTLKMNDLKNDIQSMTIGGTLDEDKVLGVYIKYAVTKGYALTDAIEAKDILAFVLENIDTNEFLSSKVSEDKRDKLTEAQTAMSNATDLLISDNYSRMLLSINLETESAESSAFVEYLLTSLKDVFGEKAHVAGEMVSTCDLQNTFDHDNLFITIFTLISIFLIVMLVFRSISLPVVLVAVIQGAIWIAMSTSLLTGPMFFMSYIMAICILMGATIDYGILMATTYVDARATLDKKEALYKAVEVAMPTVFTSGLILTVCGLVIGIISSQDAIATVGLLLGKGTLISVAMITLVLPSVLYLLDKFILKFTLRK